MDPFQRTADAAHHAFRVVPMTHLTSTRGCKRSESAWATPGVAACPPAGIETPVLGGGTAGVFPSHTTTQIQTHLHQSLESEETIRNVLKWRQFGLQIGESPSLQSAVPLRQLLQQHQPQSSLYHPTEQGASAIDLASHRENIPRRCPEERSSTQSRLCQRNNTAVEWAWASADVTGTRAVVTSAKGDELVIVSDDDDANGTKGSNAVRKEYTENSSPHGGLHTDTSDNTCTDNTLRMQMELGMLAERVQQSAEEQRCRPPKCNNNDKSSFFSAKRFGGKKRQRDAKRADNHDSEEEGNACERAQRNETAAVIQEQSALGTGTGKKPRARKHKGAATGTMAAAPTETGKRKTSKRSGGDAVFPGTTTPSGYPMPAPRVLFSLKASDTVKGSMAEVQSGPTAAVMVSVPYIYLQYSSEELFNDVRRALNDPDRIQAPPLFVGVSALGSDSSAAAGLASVGCSTNFTHQRSGAKAAKRRVSCSFSSPDPTCSHQHMELVLVRWKDNMYALPAQTVGLAFLCRILAELPGVELITFNAQFLLVAVLAYCKGTLWSHCISDVRVMAWMAQLHVATAPWKPPPVATDLVAERSTAFEDGASDADMNVLCDYEQLLLHVCGGKSLPTVQLEKMSNAGIPSHSTSSFAEGIKNSAATTAPPLTPAQCQLAQQVYYLATVYRSLYGLLGSKGLLQAFLRQEKRIALLLALMKYNGMRVDLYEVHRYQVSCEVEMERQRSLAKNLVPELGKDFNIQSHDQCRKALYEVLQLGKYALKPGNGESVSGSGLTITKGGRLSTAEDTLRSLAQYHEFPACLLRYRKVSKLMQTYVEGMMSYAVVRTQTQASPSPSHHNAGVETETDNAGESRHPVHDGDDVIDTAPPPVVREAVDVSDDNPFVDRWLQTGSSAEPGRTRNQGNSEEEMTAMLSGEMILPARGYATLHPNFLQEGTDTGRLSCVEPNLQNLPRNGITAPVADNDAQEDGEEDLLGFRRCFVAADGFVLLSIDYQQIELRVLAHLCGDATLVKALTTSADIHRTIAEVVFKKKPVSSEERSLAKRVVFGVLYGAGPKTLATHMGVTVDRALHITSLLKNAFPGIDTYHRRVIEESRTNGFVRTLSGRLRYLPDICSTVLSRRSHAERQAFNSVVQGSAADVMKMAMLAVSKEVLQRYNRSDVSLLSQIHDEMVFMVRKELLHTMVQLLSSAMSHAMQLLVPLSVTVKFGTSLGNLQEWSVEHELGVGE